MIFVVRLFLKTVPESFSVVLNMLETLGKVPLDQQLSRDPLWIGHVKAWTAELAADSPPRRPAEMYTTAMLVSLELLVCNETELIFERAMAWVILVMVWAALRCDDVQSIFATSYNTLQLWIQTGVGEDQNDWSR